MWEFQVDQNFRMIYLFLSICKLSTENVLIIVIWILVIRRKNFAIFVFKCNICYIQQA